VTVNLLSKASRVQEQVQEGCGKMEVLQKRGRTRLEEREGKTRLEALFKTMEISEISKLICKHQVHEQDKAKCEACRRTLYRAKQRLDQAKRQDKTYQPIADFANIPEIQAFVEYCKAKKMKHKTMRRSFNELCQMWTWIKESGDPELVETQRPIVWNIKHVQYVLVKVDQQSGRYSWIQALRAFFCSCNRFDMLNQTFLKARRKDMRGINGSSRPKDRFSPFEYIEKIRPILTEDERDAIDLHLTLKCREGGKELGSLLGLKWDAINWEDAYYGFPMVTATVYEPKTGGGTQWQHCPIDLWFADLSARLKRKFENRKSEYVVPFAYKEYRELWTKISEKVGEKFEAHDCRRSPSGWLRDLALSDLAIGQYDARSGKAVGFAGVGWENAEIFFQRYGKMSPLAIYDKSKRLDLSRFDGLILKILENQK